jgi:hypothetical protein
LHGFGFSREIAALLNAVAPPLQPMGPLRIELLGSGQVEALFQGQQLLEKDGKDMEQDRESTFVRTIS